MKFFDRIITSIGRRRERGIEEFWWTCKRFRFSLLFPERSNDQDLFKLGANCRCICARQLMNLWKQRNERAVCNRGSWLEENWLVQLCGDLRSVNTISLPFHENASRGEGVTSLKVRGSRLEWKYRLIFFRARYNPWRNKALIRAPVIRPGVLAALSDGWDGLQLVPN